MRYRIEAMSLKENTLFIEGWCIPSKSEQIEYSIIDTAGKPLHHTFITRPRIDVAIKYDVEEEVGFAFMIPFKQDQDGYLVMKDKNTVRKIRINEKSVQKRNIKKIGLAQKVLGIFDKENLILMADIIKDDGLTSLYDAFSRKLLKRKDISENDEKQKYIRLLKHTNPTKKQLMEQKETKFPSSPLFTVLVQVNNTNDEQLKSFFESLEEQTYSNYEVIVVDSSNCATSYASKNPGKFLYVKDQDINAGFKKAKGDYIILCKADGIFPAWAFYEITKTIINNPKALFIYMDEDKLHDEKPLFKPDMSMDLLCSFNYIGSVSVIKKELMETVNGYNSEYDFYLRCFEKATEQERKELKEYTGDDSILSLLDTSMNSLHEAWFTSETVIHIPKVLYHRLNQMEVEKEEVAIKAIKAHYDRMHIPYEDVERGVDAGYYHTTFKKPDEKAPFVSIIIPTKDHSDDLDLCIRSVIEKSEYRNLEFIVVENNSTDPKTFAYYEDINSKFNSNIPIKVIYWKREFNYSAINNFAIPYAKGDLLLFLNNDVELISPCSITEMVNYALRDNVGIVGARLLYDDNTLQHAGVIVGSGGIAGHAFRELHEKAKSYMHRSMCVQNYSALTAACIMMKKSLFNQVGGFPEDLAVAFNDIALCMKVRAMGRVNIYNPYVTFYHYESKSRGLEDSIEKIKRFNNEIRTFSNQWNGILEHGDPYYNPNLSLLYNTYSIRDVRNEIVGKPLKLAFDPEKQLEDVMKEKEKKV
ncbi:MAG: glycosyltransferase [Holdemanella sp.]|nr:glycosyltransferase [Holdemanella sp.]